MIRSDATFSKHDDAEPAVARLVNPAGKSPVLLLCEHASNHIPCAFGDLGLSPAARASHIAWDPGALPLAEAMSRVLDARLVAGCISRLVYDCNRPPDAIDAMPARSERFEIPGNRSLSAADRSSRAHRYYHPFCRFVAKALQDLEREEGRPAILVTVHSFTPVYFGKPRAIDIGILHDRDRRLADRMLAQAMRQDHLRVQRNAPYGPKDGVTHALKIHALERGLLNVMLEIRSDLIATDDDQQAIARKLGAWLNAALETDETLWGNEMRETCP